MNECKTLRAKADRARRMARDCTDTLARVDLYRLSEDYTQRARVLELAAGAPSIAGLVSEENIWVENLIARLNSMPEERR
jgi:hypothetical protein